MAFPIDISAYTPLVLRLEDEKLSAQQSGQWRVNIELMRDVIVFFTAVAGARGLSGHTGGAYDMVPEAILADGFIRGGSRVYPILFDEAGHRVALQYAMNAFNGALEFERLLHYREEDYELYGHPEITPDIGVAFASGRLGHMWALINGVAMANPGKAVLLFGSDGSQMEGDDAEAARLAVARNLDVKLLIDDNDVTIAGHPSSYLPGFDVAGTLAGHGLVVDSGDGEALDALHDRFWRALLAEGPVALVNRRVMAVGIPEIEGTSEGHEVVGVAAASEYLEARRHHAATEYLKSVAAHTAPKRSYLGSSAERGSNRKTFGSAVADLLDELTLEERQDRVLVIDTDLEGSTGLNTIHRRHPEVFISSGIMERGNLSAAAGFGFEPGKAGVFSTFAAFLEMVISEVTMARLNHTNLLCHFSHSGVDAIADNTCHYGINVFFADNGLDEQAPTPLYFPADPLQLTAVVNRTFWEQGVRFLFSVRSELPYILGVDGNRLYDPAAGYRFEPGRDEVVRQGSAGWVVSYGETLHRALAAVEQARAAGLDVGLLNKPHLNAIDETALALVGQSPFILVAEGQNRTTGLGIRYGSWLLEHGHAPRYAHLGVSRLGAGGTWAQMFHQGLESETINRKIVEMAEG